MGGHEAISPATDSALPVLSQVPGDLVRLYVRLSILRADVSDRGRRSTGGVSESDVSKEAAMSEAEKLRSAIRRAGFGVCETSGDWTIHDVSEQGKAEEKRTLEVINQNVELECRVKRLETAIKTLRSQKADDLCWMDLNKLFAVLGDGVTGWDYRVGDKAAMLKNCERFVQNVCIDGGPWSTYAELEQALLQYGWHEVDCDCIFFDDHVRGEVPGKPCSCGWRELKAKLEASRA